MKLKSYKLSSYLTYFLILVVLSFIGTYLLSGCSSKGRSSVELTCKSFPKIGVIDVYKLSLTPTFKVYRAKLKNLEDDFYLQVSELYKISDENYRREIYLKLREEFSLERDRLRSEFEQLIDGALAYVADSKGLDLILSRSKVAYAYIYHDVTDEVIEAIYSGLSSDYRPSWNWGFGKISAELSGSEQGAGELTEFLYSQNIGVLLLDSFLRFGGADYTQEFLNYIEKHREDSSNLRLGLPPKLSHFKCIKSARFNELIASSDLYSRWLGLQTRERELVERKSELKALYSKLVDSEVEKLYKDYQSKIERLQRETSETISRLTAKLDESSLPKNYREKLQTLKEKFKHRSEELQAEFERQARELNEIYAKLHSDLMERKARELRARLAEELYAQQARLNSLLELYRKQVEALYKNQKVNLQLKMMTATTKEELYYYQKQLQTVKNREQALIESYSKQLDSYLQSYYQRQNEKFNTLMYRRDREVAEKMELYYKNAIDKLRREHERKLSALQHEFSEKVNKMLRGLDVKDISAVRKRIQEAEREYRKLVKEFEGKRDAIIKRYQAKLESALKDIDSELKKIHYQEAELLDELKVRIYTYLKADRNIGLVLFDPFYPGYAEDVTPSLKKAVITR